MSTRGQRGANYGTNISIPQSWKISGHLSFRNKDMINILFSFIWVFLWGATQDYQWQKPHQLNHHNIDFPNYDHVSWRIVGSVTQQCAVKSDWSVTRLNNLTKDSNCQKSKVFVFVFVVVLVFVFVFIFLYVSVFVFSDQKESDWPTLRQNVIAKSQKSG